MWPLQCVQHVRPDEVRGGLCRVLSPSIKYNSMHAATVLFACVCDFFLKCIECSSVECMCARNERERLRVISLARCSQGSRRRSNKRRKEHEIYMTLSSLLPFVSPVRIEYCIRAGNAGR